MYINKEYHWLSGNPLVPTAQLVPMVEENVLLHSLKLRENIWWQS